MHPIESLTSGAGALAPRRVAVVCSGWMVSGCLRPGGDRLAAGGTAALRRAELAASVRSLPTCPRPRGKRPRPVPWGRKSWRPCAAASWFRGAIPPQRPTCRRARAYAQTFRPAPCSGREDTSARPPSRISLFLSSAVSRLLASSRACPFLAFSRPCSVLSSPAPHSSPRALSRSQSLPSSNNLYFCTSAARHSLLLRRRLPLLRSSPSRQSQAHCRMPSTRKKGLYTHTNPTPLHVGCGKCARHCSGRRDLRHLRPAPDTGQARGERDGHTQ